MNDSDKPQATSTPRTAPGIGTRQKAIAAVLAAFVVAGLGYSMYWAAIGRYAESTDDAFVAGNVVQITPQLAGTVVAIKADDTEYVDAGTDLVELDRADAEVALQDDSAQLAKAVRDVRSQFADSAQLQAMVAAREVDLGKARADLQRRERLAASGAVSAEEVQHARDTVDGSASALAAARRQLAGNRARTDHTTVATNPSVQRAAAKVRSAYLDLQRTVLPAPVSGLVAKRSVQLGQHVGPGTPLMAIVPLDQVWIDANFKEGQLKDLRVGQPVRLRADANGIDYRGRVAGFCAGTGAAFALLPAQNATGNWIKVVQRLPVRIALDAKDLAAHPLAIGLSMHVEVDTTRRDGAQLTRAAGPDPEVRTVVFDQHADGADRLIAQIIERNGGGNVASYAAAPVRVAVGGTTR